MENCGENCIYQIMKRDQKQITKLLPTESVQEGKGFSKNSNNLSRPKSGWLLTLWAILCVLGVMRTKIHLAHDFALLVITNTWKALCLDFMEPFALKDNNETEINFMCLLLSLSCFKLIWNS